MTETLCFILLFFEYEYRHAFGPFAEQDASSAAMGMRLLLKAMRSEGREYAVAIVSEANYKSVSKWDWGGDGDLDVQGSAKDAKRAVADLLEKTKT